MCSPESALAPISANASWTLPSADRYNYQFSTLIRRRRRTYPLTVGNVWHGEEWGTTESWHAPLTESGISLLSCNTAWQDDHDCLNMRAREKWGEVGREQCKNSSFNIVTDKESEPRHLDLPLPFLPLHPSIRYLELLICQCVPLQVRWEIRSEVLAVSAIWACCSFRSYSRAGIFISLSLHECMISCLWMYSHIQLY